MRADLEKMAEFYTSLTGLPFIILIIAIGIAVFAIVVTMRQARLLRRVIADIAWQHEQLGKRLQGLQNMIAQGESNAPPSVSVDADEIVAKLTSALSNLPTLTNLNAEIASIKSEMSRLAETMNEQEQISRAIEMAKRGARRAEIVEATGVSADQADAIVKFHGPGRG